MNVIRTMTLRQLRAEKTRTGLTLLEITIASGLLTAVLLGGLSFARSVSPDSSSGLVPLVEWAAALVSVLLLFSASFLIRSAFSVSFSQRVRALGQLASIGATRRQLRASVYWEAALLGAVAIPAGMALSALGLFITFSVLNSFEAVVRLIGPLRLCASVPGLLFCAVWCVLMLFFAACGPARAAFRVQPVESVSGLSSLALSSGIPSSGASSAISSSGPLSSASHPSVQSLRRVKMQVRKAGRIRAWKTGKPLEPQLAKRICAQDKARHRALCAGMAISLALMMTAAGFSDGLRRAYAASAPAYACRWYIWGSQDGTRPAAMLDEAARLFPNIPSLQTELYTTMLNDTSSERYVWIRENLFVLEDDDFAAWYGALLPPESGVIPYVVSQSDSREPEGAVLSAWLLHNTALLQQADVCEKPLPLHAGDSPLSRSGWYIAAVTNRTAFDAAYGTFPAVQRQFAVYYDTEDGAPLMQPLYDLESVLGERQNGGSTFFQDYSATSEWAVHRTGITLLVNVFSWGFTVLVFLASAVSVIGTVSAGIALHRREYALLASAGMTQRQLNRMLRSQCLSYCAGLPFGFVLGALFCIVLSRFLIGAVGFWFNLLVAFLGSALLVGVCLLALALVRKNLARLSVVDALRGQI